MIHVTKLLFTCLIPLLVVCESSAQRVDRSNRTGGAFHGGGATMNRGDARGAIDHFSGRDNRHTSQINRQNNVSNVNRQNNLSNIDRPNGNVIQQPQTNNRPPTGTSVPGVGAKARPGGSLPHPGGNGTVTKPVPGGVGDYLGLERSLRPNGDGNNTRPDGGDKRPDRPIVNRPVNPGDRINNNFNRRPDWVNINTTTIHNINRSWNNIIVRPNSTMSDWGNRNPSRMAFWNGWGLGVRTAGGLQPWNRGWFGPTWWGDHPFAPGGWHYYPQIAYHPFGYWWTRPAWSVFTTWFAWPTPTTAFAQPIFYDYGTGGNVIFLNNRVFLGGIGIASSGEFAESAAVLATVEPPTNQQEAEKAEWLPLGTFALSTSEKDSEPSRVVQLAVNRQGIVSGTLFNHETNQATGIQGKVDKQTQRVAFRIGNKDNVVMETGLFNLTQDQAPLLVHFGPDKNENYLLVRLESEENKKAVEKK